MALTISALNVFIRHWKTVKTLKYSHISRSLFHKIGNNRVNAEMSRWSNFATVVYLLLFLYNPTFSLKFIKAQTLGCTAHHSAHFSYSKDGEESGTKFSSTWTMVGDKLMVPEQMLMGQHSSFNLTLCWQRVWSLGNRSDYSENRETL